MNPTQGADLGAIDSTLIASYFVLVLLIGLYFARRHSGTEDYFLAGRRLGWIAIGFSLFASNISSSTLIGLCGAAYAAGISVSNYEWMASVVLVFFAIFFIPYYLSSKVYTMPEFLERRFRPAVRYYFSLLTILNNIFLDIAGALFGAAVVVRLFFPEAPLVPTALLLALVAGLYTAAGGLSAVVYTDTIQAIIILIGSTAITFIALGEVGSWDLVIANTPAEMLSVVRPLDDPDMPWLGLLTGVPILGFYFWCTNQFIVQRVLGARDVQHARWGALFAALLKLPVLFIMVFPGLMARQIFGTGIEDANSIFPMLITELLPVGLKGLMLAGVMAALMSSIDSTLNSASTLITMDFVRKLKPSTPDQTLAWIGRGTTIAIIIISAAWTPFIEDFRDLFQYLQTMLAYLVPPVAAIFIVGLFWKRANGTGALAALLTGHGLAALQLIFGVIGSPPWNHFLIVAFFLFLASVATCVVVSLATDPPPTDKVRRYTYSKQTAEETIRGLDPLPWYKDYRFQSAILLGLSLLLVITYW